MGVPNNGDRPIDQWFGTGMAPSFYSTGAGAGSSPIPDQPSFGAQIHGEIAVASDPYESAQAPRTMTTVDAGDTQVPHQYPGKMPVAEVVLADGASGAPVTAGQYNAGTLGTTHIIPVPSPDNPAREGHPNAAAYGPVTRP